jgi:hypothetical protein
MPLYFFDSCANGIIIEDDTGLQFSDLTTSTSKPTKNYGGACPGRASRKLSRELCIEVRDRLGPLLKAVIRFEAVMLRPT